MEEKAWFDIPVVAAVSGMSMFIGQSIVGAFIASVMALAVKEVFAYAVVRIKNRNSKK